MTKFFKKVTNFTFQEELKRHNRKVAEKRLCPLCNENMMAYKKFYVCTRCQTEQER